MSNDEPSVDVEPEEEELYEPHDYDPYYSGLASFVFHFCLFIILPFLSSIVRSEDKLPPAVDVVQVIDNNTEGSDTFSDMPSGLEAQETELPSETPMETPPTPELDKSIPKEAPPELEFNPEELENSARDAVRKARAAAAAAASAAASQMTENLGGSPPTSSSGGSGRAGRAARWVLRFNTRTPRDYLGQLGGLEADIAFPGRGDNYIYYTDLDSSPTRSSRTLDRENRIFWIDQDTFQQVADHLGISAPMMVAFLPTTLEEKMSKLEMARARERGVTREEDIKQTVFECVHSGRGYDVIVVDQTLVGG